MYAYENKISHMHTYIYSSIHIYVLIYIHMSLRRYKLFLVYEALSY